MNKRTFLKSTCGALAAPFLLFNSKSEAKENTSAISTFKTIGKITEISISHEYDLANIFDRGDFHVYPYFPIETIVTITGERGILAYHTWNMILEDMQYLQLHPRKVLCDIKETYNKDCPFTHCLMYKGKIRSYELKLGSVAFTGQV